MQAVPEYGEGVGEADGRGKSEQTQKSGFYGTVLNTCLSFLNEGKMRSGTVL